MQEHRYPPAAQSLLDSSWTGDDGNHLLNTPPSTLDHGIRPLDPASLYEAGAFGSPELSDKGDLLFAPQASTQLVTHPISTHTDGDDHDAVLTRNCDCISCLGIWKSQDPSYRDNGEAYYSCRLLGCLHTETIEQLRDEWTRSSVLAILRRHEKAHFGTNGHFKCLSDHCNFVTKRWSDLKRHSTVMHCKNARKIPCPVPYCKFAGDNNGFLRKDKLTTHINRVHKGVKAAPPGTLRAIKAAPAKEAVDGTGSASGDKAA